MANRSFAGLPLPSVIFRSQSFANLNSSPSQAPLADYSGNYATTETALPRFRNDAALAERLTAAPAPAPAPAQEQTGELKKKRSFFASRRTAEPPPSPTPSKTKKSAWSRVSGRVKRSFSGLKPKKKTKEMVISNPYDFQHIGGVETLIAARRAAMAAEQPIQEGDAEEDQASFDDGNSAWEDVTEQDIARRI